VLVYMGFPYVDCMLSFLTSTHPSLPPSPPPPPQVVSATLAARSRFFKSMFELPFTEQRSGQILYLTASSEEGG